jgi:hypothetical protein
LKIEEEIAEHETACQLAQGAALGMKSIMKDSKKKREQEDK